MKKTFPNHQQTTTTMRNKIGVFSKIGYLRPRTGRYEWADVVGIDAKAGTLKMRSVIRQGRQTFENVYTERTDNVVKFLATPSPDHADGRPLLKHKGFTGLHTPDHLNQYMNSQQVTMP